LLPDQPLTLSTQSLPLSHSSTLVLQPERVTGTKTLIFKEVDEAVHPASVFKVPVPGKTAGGGREVKGTPVATGSERYSTINCTYAPGIPNGLITGDNAITGRTLVQA
jgi:hypothetical protein